MNSKNEAIEKVNNSPFNSGVTIWTSNISKAVEIAKKLDIQKIGINQGYKSSNDINRSESISESEKNDYIDRFKIFSKQKKITYKK